ncbi:hypothetical protein [Streptomyces mirabilis]
MTNTPGLRPEDRADFESVLRLALGLIDIRSALLGEPTVRTSASLYAQALAAAEEITAAASDEYRDYLAVRKAAERLKSLRSKRFPTVDGALWAALVVLTPLVAGAAAAVLLLIGHGLHLADAERRFGHHCRVGARPHRGGDRTRRPPSSAAYSRPPAQWPRARRPGT